MYKFYRCILLLVLPLIVRSQSLTPAPDVRFENFNSQNHFTSRQILSIAVDKRGYVWTSGAGVQRFDGYKTVQFSSFNTTVHTIKDSYAHIIADNDGRIWASSGGLSYYDDDSDSFVYIQPGGKKAPFIFAHALSVNGDYLWFVCDYGLAKINVRTLKITYTSLVSVIDPLCSYMVNKHTLLVSSRQKVYLYNTVKDTYSEMILTYNNSLVKVYTAIGTGSEVLLGTTLGLFKLKNLKEITLISPETKDIEVDDLHFLSDDKDKRHLYMATDGKGLMVYNTAEKRIEATYLHDENNPYSLPTNIILGMFTDNAGRLWMAMQTGISLLSKHNQQWKIRYLDKKEVEEQSVTKIAQDPGDSSKVWLSCNNRGMVRIDWGTKTIEKSYCTTPEMRQINDFAPISKHRWLLVTSKKIMEWSPEKGIISMKALPLPDSLSLGCYIRKIILTDRGDCYITTNKGLFRYDLAEKKITVEIASDKDEGGLHVHATDLVNGFYDNGELWIGSRNGLINFNTSTKTVRRYNGKPYKDYYTFEIAKDGNNILCSVLSGLAIFDRQSKSFRIINKLAGLVKPTCIAAGVSGRDILLGTEVGLMKFDFNTLKAAQVETDNELMRVVPKSSFSAIGHDMAVGFMGGYAYYQSGAQERLKVSEPIIEGLSVNNQPVLNGYSNKKLRFSYTDNSINIPFTAFQYSSPDNIKFRYRLKGADKDWQYPENQRSANYAQLSSGSYTFYVQSGDKNNNWNPVIASLSFVIAPPFWATWWFMAFIVLVIASILYLLYQYKIAHLKAIETIRQNIASDFHDDLGSTLSSISIFSEVAVQKTDTDLAGAKTLVGDIGVRARAMINSMNDMVWTIKPENDNLYKLMQRMEEFSYPVAEAKETQLVFLMDESLYNIKTDMVKRKNLFLIFKEAFNNAVKYSGAGNIHVTFKLNNNKTLLMQVTDNGYGFKYESKRPGNGLANMHKRAAEIKGKLTVITAPGEGTEINIICKIT
ncbi:sensor histidine kinase [Mucilaginibacter xinganensis]|uniref:Histidine kinase domain-containing protein n=1 Tax=Mucilaginibacter xinganensis TaxID=1234841 RepID=A0A223NS89_9SPHI|nr:sensor histidine kinase [Mucilaginibacter xinganensis]ASU32554.1 hypothetical protein MuYL_0651 [Mucilaginibacter xinganensis]